MKKISILIPFLLFVNILPAFAEVLMDGTMGTAGKINGPTYDIRAEYGQQSGTNLFHSFKQFNINTSEIANFGVSPETQNIISRVTGGSQSWIDGTLSSTITGTSQISGANLYLLNPAGVLFGANASLNLGGSFHVSTADYLRMGEYERFYAAQANEVLSVSPPAAFGFLDNDIAPITFEGEISDTSDTSKGLLSVPTGETLSVIGGDIQISGTYYETDEKDVPLPRLEASEGNIHIVSAASQGEVVLNQISEVSETLEAMKLGNITLDHAIISSSGEGSGNIFIRCGAFFAEDSSIKADTIGDKDGGVTDIQADTLELNRSDIFSDTTGTGNGGNVVLRINESADISDFSRVFADATGEGSETGSAGTVLIEAKNISLDNGAKVSAETYGKSKGGSVTLLADEEIRLSDGSQIFSQTTGKETESGAGDAGIVMIEAKNISLYGEESLISSDTNSDGEGGNIFISGKDGEFAESIRISNSRIYAGAGSSGNGGFVEIKADSITLDGGSIDSKSFGMGTGKGGDISIYATESLSLKNTGGITASTEGPGNAGEISLEVGSLTLDTKSFLSSESTSKGDGGDAGIILIRTDNGVSLSGNSKITTEAANAGKGQIHIETAGSVWLSDGTITTSIRKGGENAGDIYANQEYLVLNHSQIIANAYEGKGGNIHLIANPFIRSSDSKVDASSKLGIDGTVYIEAPDEDVSKGLTLLPDSFPDVSQWLNTPCSARSGESASRFVFSGRDGVKGFFHGDFLPSGIIFMSDSLSEPEEKEHK